METGYAPPDHASTLSSRPRLHPQNGGVYQTLVWLSPGVRFFNLQLFGSLPKLESVNYMKPFQSLLWAVTLSFYIVTFRSHPCVLELPPPGTVSLCSKQPAPNYVSLIFCCRNVWPLLTAITDLEWNTQVFVDAQTAFIFIPTSVQFFWRILVL